MIPRFYDAMMRMTDQGVMGSWRRRIVGASTGRTIEIGAGTGLGLRHYRPGTEVIAVDPDLSMLRRARARASRARTRIQLVAADAQCLPFRHSQFDSAVVALALCTIPDPDGALKELSRVLRPGAWLRVLEHVRVDQPLVARLQDWATPVWKRIFGGCRLNRRTPQSVVAAGFDVHDTISHVGGLFREITARRAGGR